MRRKQFDIIYTYYSRKPTSIMKVATKLFYYSLLVIIIVPLQVALLNFSQHYADYQTPARIDVNNFSSRVLSMTVPHDIMTAEKLIDPYRVSHLAIR